MPLFHTSEDIAIASAIISNPASILRIFLDLATVINLFDKVNATPAGSFPSDDEGPLLEYWVLVFSRSPHVFEKISNTFVGGLRSSNN